MAKNEFGQRLKTAFRNATNAVIGEQIGVAEGTVGFYVRGRVPDSDVLTRISEATNCNLHWLLTGVGPMTLETAKGQGDSRMTRILAGIATEQAPSVYADVEIAGSSVVEDTFRLLQRYLMAQSLLAFHLIEKEADVLSLVEILRAQKFTFLSNRTQSIDEQIRNMINGATAGKSVSHVAQEGDIRDMIRELVQEEIANGRKSPLIHLDFGHKEDEEDVPRRKAG